MQTVHSFAFHLTLWLLTYSCFYPLLTRFYYAKCQTRKSVFLSLLYSFVSPLFEGTKDFRHEHITNRFICLFANFTFRDKFRPQKVKPLCSYCSDRNQNSKAFLLSVFQRFRLIWKTVSKLSWVQLSQTIICIPEDISFIALLGSKPGRINCDSGLLAIYLRVHLLIFLFFTLDNGDLRQSGTTLPRSCLVSVVMHVRKTI